MFRIATVSKHFKSHMRERNPSKQTIAHLTYRINTSIGPLQTLNQDLQPQQITLPDPTHMSKRPNILRCYGTQGSHLHYDRSQKKGK